MCGILFHAGEPRPPAEVLRRALARMTSRGPDFESLHFGDGFAVGHTRLSIIDLSPEANQPFWDASQRWALSYNGEIYNYLEIRADLLRAGRRLRTQSDTEVLLESILHFGLEPTLARVRGMFAFVLYDTASGELIAARDHFGQKPLYYLKEGGAVAIASDVRSLVDLRGRTEPDLTSYAVYLCPAGEDGTRGVFHRDRTFFEGIRMLPAGHMLVGRPGSISIKEYFNTWSLFDAEALERNRGREREDCKAELKHHLSRAVARHLVSDVPVGVLLSGGIDSTLAFWFAHEMTDDLTAFTKISPGIEEIPLTVVPKVLERRPASTYFSLQRSTDYVAELQSFVRASGAPSRWGGGPPMLRLCRDARRNGVYVLLGGDCADEYLGGYSHYEAIAAEPSPDLFAPAQLTALDAASPFYDAERAREYEDGERAIRRRIVARLESVADPTERALHAALLHDTSSFLQTCNLPHSDAYSMMTSVELRNPMLDLDLVAFAVNLPTGLRAGRHPSGHFGKTLLRDLADDEIGPFMNVKKEGTRNYAMAMARPEYWHLNRFAIGQMFRIPQGLTRRTIIRLVNLELFHRLFMLGETDALAAMLTDNGRSVLTRATPRDQ